MVIYVVYSNNEREEILRLYKSGLNTVEISNIIKRSQSGIERYLKREGLFKKTSTKKCLGVEKEIISLYLKGYSSTYIAKKYKICGNTVARILRDNSIQVRDQHGCRFSNEDYFEAIDNEYKAYFLGLIVTDGCIQEVYNKNNRLLLRLTIDISIEDHYLLKMLLQELGSQNRITITPGRTTGKVTFGSNKLCTDLSKYGVVPRKTFKTYLPMLDDKLMPHLIRGIFDGDGCVCSQSTGRSRVTFYGTHRICSEIQDHLITKLNINKNKIFDKQTVSMYAIGSRENVRLFYNYIYKNANIYMIRKKEKFIL